MIDSLFWEHACTLGTVARRHWNEPSMHAGSPEGQWSTVQLPHLTAFFQHRRLWHEQLCESLYQGEVEKATTCSSVDHQQSVHIPENKVQIKINIPLPTCRHNPLRHTPFTMCASGGSVNMPHPTPQCVASTCVQDQTNVITPVWRPHQPTHSIPSIDHLSPNRRYMPRLPSCGTGMTFHMSAQANQVCNKKLLTKVTRRELYV